MSHTANHKGITPVRTVLLILLLAVLTISFPVRAYASQGPAEAPEVPFIQWTQSGDDWYGTDRSGNPLQGWAKYGACIYYFYDDGKAAAGWAHIDGGLYHFKSDANLDVYTGWKTVEDDGNWYYFDGYSGCYTGPHTINGYSYYFDSEGVMQTGWQTVDGKLYYYQEEAGSAQGQMVTGGYRNYNGTWYRLDPDGAVEELSIQGDYLVVYDVTSSEFGANGSDQSPDGRAINSALIKAAKLANPQNKEILILIPDGTYYIEENLFVFDNMHLSLSSNAVIKRSDPTKCLLLCGHLDGSGNICYGSSCTHGGYSQVSNVTISGGAWDGNVTGNSSLSHTTLISLAHGAHFTIRDTAIRNASCDHLLILDGMQDVLIDNVALSNVYYYTGSDDSYYGSSSLKNPSTAEQWYELARGKEAIHLDYVSPGSSASYPQDGTGCKDITVQNCTFRHVLAGIGGHHTLDGHSQSGISLVNNTFSDCKGNVINAYQMTDLTVKDNTVSNAPIFLYASVPAGSCKDFTVTGNDLGGISMYGIYLYDAVATVSHNVLHDLGAETIGIYVNTSQGASDIHHNSIDKAKEGITVRSSANTQVHENTVTNCLRYAIYVHKSTNVSVTGNTAIGTTGSEKFDICFYDSTGGSCCNNVVTSDVSQNIYINSSTVTNSGNTVLSGWVQAGGVWYYYRNGSPVTGWLKDGGNWYFFDSSGAMRTGWLQQGKTWYFFDSSGYMHTGWLQQGKTWYFFADSGYMKTGWLQQGKTWYFFADSGYMKTGWLQQGNAWYFFDGNGAMHTGWLQQGSAWFFFSPNGYMHTGWLQQGNAWFFFSPNGYMHTGWLQQGKDWYYFNSSGYMLTGRQQIGGVWYEFDSSGRWIG